MGFASRFSAFNQPIVTQSFERAKLEVRLELGLMSAFLS
jgi:hypothetical protein